MFLLSFIPDAWIALAVHIIFGLGIIGIIVGTGSIAGVGVGAQGEPGVNKKKGLTPFLSFIRRKKPQ
jgi:hypothetical protein